MAGHSSMNGGGEQVAIDGECRAPRYSCLVRTPRHDRAEEPHLGLEEPVRVGGLGALDRVRAHELGQTLGLVCRRPSHTPHLVNDYIVPALGELPRGLAPRETAADDMNRVGHRAPWKPGIGRAIRRMTSNVGHPDGSSRYFDNWMTSP